MHKLGQLSVRTQTGEEVPAEDVQDLVARISELRIAATAATDHTDAAAVAFNDKPIADPAQTQPSQIRAAK